MFIITKSHKKNLNICHLNVIHMHIIAVCTYFATICLLSASDFVPLFVTITISSYAFLVTQLFILFVLNIIHVLDLESISV